MVTVLTQPKSYCREAGDDLISMTKELEWAGFLFKQKVLICSALGTSLMKVEQISVLAQGIFPCLSTSAKGDDSAWGQGMTLKMSRFSCHPLHQFWRTEEKSVHHFKFLLFPLLNESNTLYLIDEKLGRVKSIIRNIYISVTCYVLTRTGRSNLMASKQQLPQICYWAHTWKPSSSVSASFLKDLEHCIKQADFPELLQNEDVSCRRDCAHDFWGDTQSLQPHVSMFCQARCCSTQVLICSVLHSEKSSYLGPIMWTLPFLQGE